MDSDEAWMKLALEEAQSAYERGDWPTGAVLVQRGKLIGRGQNRQVTQGDVTLHAEVDALKDAFRVHGPQAAAGATLYCTMEPCPMCAGALKLAGVGRLVVALRHATLRRVDLGNYAIESFFSLTGYDMAFTCGVLESEYLAIRLRWGGDQVAPAASVASQTSS